MKIQNANTFFLNVAKAKGISMKKQASSDIKSSTASSVAKKDSYLWTTQERGKEEEAYPTLSMQELEQRWKEEEKALEDVAITLLAKSRAPTHLREDWKQELMLKAWKSALNWNPNKGASLMTFCYQAMCWRIVQLVRRFGESSEKEAILMEKLKDKLRILETLDDNNRC